MTQEVLNPLEIPDWDTLVRATGKASFFHSSAWARVLHETYGYKPLYFSSIEHGSLSSLMPFMEVDSWLTGRRGVSLPFSDRCGLLRGREIGLSEMIPPVFEYGRGRGWKCVEWRDGASLKGGETVLATFQNHILDLDRDPEALFSNFRSSTRRNIRKAGREGVHTEVLASSESVKAFYRLHCVTRKSHGYPPQPYQFFKKIFEHIISPGKGFVVLALFDKKPIAGAVFVHFGETVIYKYGASDRSYLHLRPNDLVMWEAIQCSATRGFKFLDFGRTDLDQEGLLRFKAGWGAESYPVLYYKYDFRKDDFVGKGSGMELAGRVARKLPMPIFNLLGALLYRHIG